MKLILKTGLLAAVLTALVGSTPANALFGGNIGAGPPPVVASKCIAGKAKCIIKKKSCLLGCYSKGLGKGLAADTACLAKCHDKFDGGADLTKGCFAKLELKGGCGASTNDFAAFEAKIDAHVLDIVAELNPAGGNPLSKCAAAKVKAVGKYNACVLGLVAKAAGAGGPIDTIKLAKCTSGISATFGKADTKGPDCLTGGDAIAQQNKDDAFVDDVIAELVTGPNDLNTQRCNGDTSVKCTSAPGGVAGCGGPLGTCEFYFGAPLPLAAGGIATCVTSQWNGGITGTFNQQTGASGGTALLLSRVYNGIAIATPCPRCVGDSFPNDGVNGGTCSGGDDAGQACDANGASPEPSFGSTSLDCRPSAGGLIATIPVDLTNTTGTITNTVTASSPTCNGTPGERCLCATCSEDSSKPCKSNADCVGTCTNAAGEPRKANSCLDDTTTGPDESLCAATGNGEGSCPSSTINQRCNIETFRGCTTNLDCPFPGDACGANLLECFPGYNGVIGDTISATGAAAAPRNHAGTQTFASVFCLAPTGSSSVNTVAGLPGPGRLTLGGVGQENGTSGVCPTVASFLPTVRGGVLDTGWTGISHDAKVVGQGKVSVQVTGCAGAAPNCGQCSYTGPIANPNANP